MGQSLDSPPNIIKIDSGMTWTVFHWDVPLSAMHLRVSHGAYHFAFAAWCFQVLNPRKVLNEMRSVLTLDGVLGLPKINMLVSPIPPPSLGGTSIPFPPSFFLEDSLRQVAFIELSSQRDSRCTSCNPSKKEVPTIKQHCSFGNIQETPPSQFVSSTNHKL